MNRGLQYKLFSYQVKPPDDAWDRINSVLDEEAGRPFTERLVNYEEDPPPFLWDNITAVLDEHKTTVPFRKRFSKSLRYSTAAACFIIVAVLVTLLINKRSISNETTIASEQVIAPAKTKSEVVYPDPAKGEINKEEEDIKKRNRNAKILPIDVRHSLPTVHRSEYVVAHNFTRIGTDLPDRYIIYSTSAGEAFRISKKLFDLFACSDENQKCKENIELVQQQIASPTIMASADFSGLLDLLQSINN